MIFDTDGLLLDTESVWTRAEEDLFAARGREFTFAHKLELVGSSAQVAGGVLARQLGEPGAERELIAGRQVGVRRRLRGRDVVTADHHVEGL